MQIYTGIETEKFGCYPDPGAPLHEMRRTLGEDSVIVGTIGRSQKVKNQIALVDAFAKLVSGAPDLRQVLRLVIVGDGPERQRLLDRLNREGLLELSWIPGARDDIPGILQSMDIFVLPSLMEGISNTILEAMASSLPIIAFPVGGNSELVESGTTGMLVESDDSAALAGALEHYVRNKAIRQRHGRAGKDRALSLYSIDSMVNGYLKAYRRVLAEHQG
jgi:glycosyltransferase involved in cell wall biosynthesis